MRLATRLLGLSQMPQFGEYVAAEGGYFFGIMAQADGDYAYFLAPKSAEVTSVWCDINDTNKSADARSALDGWDNTVKIAAMGASWSAARYCRAYTGGGHTDWFLWAREEAELAARTLAPIAFSSTSTTYGAVPASIPPYPSYAEMPSEQTIAPDFVDGASQALDQTIYWCSGVETGGQCQAIYFTTGIYANTSKSLSRKVRPIRKVRISARTRQDVLGSAFLSGPGQWVVPEGVTSISVLCVPAGAYGSSGGSGSYGSPGGGGAGGQNGVARYMNNIAVTPGQVISYHVGTPTGNRNTTFGTYITESAGGTPVVLTPSTPSGGADGGPGSGSAIGASGNGHRGFDLTSPLINLGYNTNKAGLWPGGSGGGGGGGQGPLVGGSFPGDPGGVAGNGAIRILFDGERRQFPNTFTADEFAA